MFSKQKHYLLDKLDDTVSLSVFTDFDTGKCLRSILPAIRSELSESHKATIFIIILNEVRFRVNFS